MHQSFTMNQIFLFHDEALAQKWNNLKYSKHNFLFHLRRIY